MKITDSQNEIIKSAMTLRFNQLALECEEGHVVFGAPSAASIAATMAASVSTAISQGAEFEDVLNLILGIKK